MTQESAERSIVADGFGPEFSHAGTAQRLTALRAVVEETGATANQVVLAWLMGGELPVIPLVGASSVAQLEESLAAADLELSAGQRARLPSLTRRAEVLGLVLLLLLLLLLLLFCCCVFCCCCCECAVQVA